ncbi:hypothetical protein V6N11_028619 [Hibiscus sabdariffa]|uniref:RNase H type-1 domain-containing protein n=1 Tax=Hibiscus sabdariffa TaxID=183260 RepID=A0ABR2PQD3_9ROSI
MDVRRSVVSSGMIRESGYLVSHDQWIVALSSLLNFERCAMDSCFRRVEMKIDNKEVAAIAARSSLTLDDSVLVLSLRELLQMDWDVKVLHIPLDSNVVTDKVAALRHSLFREGLVFVVSLDPVAATVEVEQAQWNQ